MTTLDGGDGTARRELDVNANRASSAAAAGVQEGKQRQSSINLLGILRSVHRHAIGRGSINQYWHRIQTFVSNPLLGNNIAGINHNVKQSARRVQPQQLKVRVISWNMHDSLPKGNIEELLGKVPSYVPTAVRDETTLPVFEEGPDHPYHIIVVAGQECPTVSGLPMGIAGFKLNEKDKIHLGRSKSSRNQDNKDDTGHAEDESTTPPQNQDSTTPTPHRQNSLFRKAVNLGHHISIHTSSTPQVATTSGWSYILEDWYCRGIGSVDGAKATLVGGKRMKPKLEGEDAECESPTTPSPDREHGQDGTIGVTWATDVVSSNVMPTTSDGEADETILGPYELLSKERLMGIYICVFVHREVRPLVKGVSKNTVATGLLHGRFGNKGGAGVSVNVADTRLLFICAHLAAHEGNVATRLADFSRIKAEMNVDAFLQSNDSKLLSEDITDRFDHTFFFGDLNFRLDVSRLHADWLIAKKDYEKALKFDQLRNVMERKGDFIGFSEGHIDFPPTYKYDVLKTIKQQRQKRRLHIKEAHRKSLEEEKNGTGHREEPSNGDYFYSHPNDSAASSVWTDGPSGSATGSTPDIPMNNDSPDSDQSAASPRKTSNRKVPFGLGIAGLKHFPEVFRQKSNRQKRLYKLKTSSATAIKSAKSSPSVMTVPEEAGGSFFATVIPSTPEANLSTESINTPIPSTSLPTSRRLQAEDQLRPSLSTGDLIIGSPDGSLPSHLSTSPKTPSGLRRAFSSKDAIGLSPSTSSETDSPKTSPTCERGVYDSSSKKRVPSWCDRILWKTTVEPEPEEEAEEEYFAAESSSRRMPFMKYPGMLLDSITPRSRSGTSLLGHGKADVGVLDDPKNPSGLRRALSSRERNLSEPLRTRMRKVKTMDVTSTVADFPRKATVSSSPLRNGYSPEVGSPENMSPTSPRKPKPQALPARRPSLISDSDGQPGEGPLSADMGNAAKRWLLSFIHREPSSGNLDIGAPPGLTVVQEVRRKGDVVCTHYGTLDDEGMRRLEGRSDHRPIFGSYSLYV